MSTRTCMKSAAARSSPSGRRGGGRRRGTRGDRMRTAREGRRLPLRQRDGGPHRMSRSDPGKIDGYPPEFPHLSLLSVQSTPTPDDTKEHDTLPNKPTRF